MARFTALRPYLEDGGPLTRLAQWVQRLFAQIVRVLEINQLRTITKEVVETARESLVVGPLP